MTILLQDDFTDTVGTSLDAHTMNVGAGWTLSSLTGGTPVYEIDSSNRAIAISGLPFAIADAGQTDYQIDLTVDITGIGTYYAPCLVVRHVDVDNTWLIDRQRDGAGAAYISIAERVGGVQTVRAQIGGIVAGDVMRYTVLCVGNTIRFLLDTGETITWPSATNGNTSTLCGLLDVPGVAGAGGTYAAAPMDNFIVRTLPVISGVVTENSVNKARTVNLYRRSTGALVATTTSNGTTGAYDFDHTDGIIAGVQYYAVALDDLGTAPNFNAKITDQVEAV